jgi:hypothetical protein
MQYSIGVHWTKLTSYGSALVISRYGEDELRRVALAYIANRGDRFEITRIATHRLSSTTISSQNSFGICGCQNSFKELSDAQKTVTHLLGMDICPMEAVSPTAMINPKPNDECCTIHTHRRVTCNGQIYSAILYKTETGYKAVCPYVPKVVVSGRSIHVVLSLITQAIDMQLQCEKEMR